MKKDEREKKKSRKDAQENTHFWRNIVRAPCITKGENQHLFLCRQTWNFSRELACFQSLFHLKTCFQGKIFFLFLRPRPLPSLSLNWRLRRTLKIVAPCLPAIGGHWTPTTLVLWHLGTWGRSDFGGWRVYRSLRGGYALFFAIESKNAFFCQYLSQSCHIVRFLTHFRTKFQPKQSAKKRRNGISSFQRGWGCS